MGIADKFVNFQIKKSDRISQEDQAWLTHREELYKRAIAVYKSVYDIYKAEYDLDREYYRYNDSDPIKELVVDFIDYHAVLDKIFDQLGGMSFEEKAIKEVKDKLKEKCYNGYRDTWEIKVKGNKFTYTGGYCSKDKYFDYYNFGSTEWLRAFIDALAFNTYGEKTQVYSLNHLYSSYSIRLEEDDFQNGFSAPEVGVKHVKLFKNGRIDVTFTDAEFCRKFAREWCGYTLI